MASLLKKYLSQTSNPSTGAVAYLAALDQVGSVAPNIRDSIIAELKDQRQYLKLIASENYSSLAVQLAMGNLLTDKYAEGYARHRFYAGCEHVDEIEESASEELKTLFRADHAYVQPHSGADANMIAHWAVLTQRIQTPAIKKLGKKSLSSLSNNEFETIRQLLINQKMLGMSLNSGGHLTHGFRQNSSAKMFRCSSYDVDPTTGRLNEQLILEQAQREQPAILMAGYSAYPRLINFAKMREIADSVGAILMVDMAHFSGLVAGQALTNEYNPIPYADIITSTTHKTLRGPRGGMILCKSEFADAVNKGCPMVMGGPLPHVIAAKAVAFKEANSSAFRAYAKQIIKNAQALGRQLQQRGIKLLTDGTDNHMLIIDLSTLPITGLQAEQALRASGITVNRNAIPFDQNGVWHTSGIRIGTPALTTLGMGCDEMASVADMIADVLLNTTPQSGSKRDALTPSTITQQVHTQVRELLHAFPLYPDIPLE